MHREAEALACHQDFGVRDRLAPRFADQHRGFLAVLQCRLAEILVRGGHDLHALLQHTEVAWMCECHDVLARIDAVEGEAAVGGGRGAAERQCLFNTRRPRWQLDDRVYPVGRHEQRIVGCQAFDREHRERQVRQPHGAHRGQRNRVAAVVDDTAGQHGTLLEHEVAEVLLLARLRRALDSDHRTVAGAQVWRCTRDHGPLEPKPADAAPGDATESEAAVGGGGRARGFELRFGRRRGEGVETCQQQDVGSAAKQPHAHAWHWRAGCGDDATAIAGARVRKGVDGRRRRAGGRVSICRLYTTDADDDRRGV